jgi:hypothetical protein
MSRYIMIRRLRGPAFLLLVGALALLNQANILSWGKSWPFFLILAGVFQLAERAILAAEGGYPQGPYPGVNPGYAPPPDAPDPRAATGIPAYPGQPTAIIPAPPKEYGIDREGGKS